MFTKNRFKKAILTTLLAFSLSPAALPAEPDVFESEVSISLADSVSSVPFGSITADTYLQTIVTQYGGGWDQSFVGNFLITGLVYHPYKAFELPGQLSYFNTFIIHDISTGTLVEKSRLKLAAGRGVITAAASPVSSLRFLAASMITPKTPPTVPDVGFPAGPYDYILEIYSYNANGIINTTPISIVNWKTVNPNMDENLIAYNAVVNFSHDGKYLFYTSANASGGVVTSTIFGALAIDSNGIVNPTPVATVTLPAGPTPTHFFVPQPAVKTFIYPAGSTNYKTVVGLLAYVPATTTGGTAQNGLVLSYNFNPVAGTFGQPTGSLEVPKSLRGADLNPQGNRIAVITGPVSASAAGPSVKQIPSAPFGNVPDPGKEFRLYSFNRNASTNAIAYIGGHDLESEGWNLKWSRSGDYLAYTASPVIIMNGVFPVGYPILNTHQFSPAVGATDVVVLEFNGTDGFTIMDSKPASFQASDIAWSADDEFLSIGSSPSLILKDIQLWRVVPRSH
jgi:hypothetical protein